MQFPGDATIFRIYQKFQSEMFFLSASTDLKLHFTQEEGGTFVHNLLYRPTLPSKFAQVSICNDNTYVALLSEREKPQILAIKERDNVRVIHTINIGGVTALQFKHSTKKNIALGTKTGDVILYDTKMRNISTTFSNVCESIRALDFSCDDNQLCGIGDDIFFVIAEPKKKHSVQKIKQNSLPMCLKCHPFIANRAGLGHQNGSVSVWDLESCLLITTLDFLQSPVVGITMSTCDSLLMIGETEVRLCGLDFKTGDLHLQMTLEQENVLSAVDLSKDGKYLAVGMNDGTVKLYDMKQHIKKIFAERLHNGPVTRIVFDNKPKEMGPCASNFSFTSMIKASELQLDVCPPSPSTINHQPRKTETMMLNTMKQDNSSELLKLKTSVMRMIKAEMEGLESLLQSHCAKFQKFLDNEFDNIDATTRRKWDIFKAANANQIVKVLGTEDGSEGE